MRVCARRACRPEPGGWGPRALPPSARREAGRGALGAPGTPPCPDCPRPAAPGRPAPALRASRGEGVGGRRGQRLRVAVPAPRLGRAPLREA